MSDAEIAVQPRVPEALRAERIRDRPATLFSDRAADVQAKWKEHFSDRAARIQETPPRAAAPHLASHHRALETVAPRAPTNRTTPFAAAATRRL